MSAELLPELNAVLNTAITLLLLSGYAAIRRGNRHLHPRLMLTALALGLLFAISYVAQVWLIGHTRFPGNDWVRVLFLAILGTHIALAVAVVPLLGRTLFLAARQRFAEHRRWAHVTFPIWLYVAVTGVIIYWMNQHLRPAV